MFYYFDILPATKRINLDPRIADKIYQMPPSKDRQNLRSKTPVGFAEAVFQMYSKRKSKKSKKKQV